ncbi:MAG: TIGR02647 family protein [Halopseudomonas yangmingensis]|uniref:TIGR02647 family protein n=1 Tax=Halopseudomonas yangmingensis TaxID=1720063 RepID=A0A1I4PJ53_9GAMM|nr:TIGR02647 family protein [Halopseudomonas yangmingensis]SFM27596.1 TIGR02647 family protein [Halopseudomonas yangmingensis]
MLSKDEIDEINLLAQFSLDSDHAGLKVHSHEADPALVAAAARLHARGLITQVDGGYLTSLGLDAAEHVQALLIILRAR